MADSNDNDRSAHLFECIRRSAERVAFRPYDPALVRHLGAWLTDAQREFPIAESLCPDESDDDTDRARDAAQMAVYEIRGLVGAAECIVDECVDDVRVEQCLKAAMAKLKALSDALDSVNWPKS